MKRIWKRYLAALLVFTMVLNSTGATVLAETVRNGLVSHVQMKNTAQNLGLASGSNQINEEGELASTSDASSSDADIPCTKNDDCEALPGNHDIECPLYEGELLDDVSTPSNAILAMGFGEADKELQYQKGSVGMKVENIKFPETMELTLMDLETGNESVEAVPVTWEIAQSMQDDGFLEFDAGLHSVLDENGNPILDENGNELQDLLTYNWIFTPVVENEKDYDWTFLPDGYETWDDYAMERAGIMLEIGIMTLEGEILINLENLNATSGAYIEINESEGTVTLLRDSVTYKITGNGAYGIQFAEDVSTANLILENVSNATSHPSIDLEGISTASITLAGEENTLGTTGRYAALRVPEDTSLTISGTEDVKLTAVGGGSSAGIGGSRNENSGNITIEGGDIKVTSGEGAAAIGAGAGGEKSGNITITGGQIWATGGYAPAFGVNEAVDVSTGVLKVSSGATVFATASGETDFGVINGMKLDIDSSALFLVAALDEKVFGETGTLPTENTSLFEGVFQSSLSTLMYFTFFGKDIQIPAFTKSFAFAAPKGASSTLEGTVTENGVKSNYLGTPEGGSDTVSTYTMSQDGGITKYVDIYKEDIPYFWDFKKRDITEDGVRLIAEIDTDGSDKIVTWPSGATEELQSNLPKLDVGFVCYSDPACTNVIKYYNKNVPEGSTTPIAEADWDDSHKDDSHTGFLEIIITGLEPGHTYYFRPYARNSAGLYVAQYISRLNNGSYSIDYNTVTEEVIIPNVHWPKKIQLTYGTDINQFASTEDNLAASDVELTVEKTEGDPTTEITGTFSYLKSELMKDYPEYDKGGLSNLEGTFQVIGGTDPLKAGTYNGEDGNNGKLTLQFDPDDGYYTTLEREIPLVIVNPLPVKAVDLANKTKVYDSTTAAPTENQSITLEATEAAAGYAIVEYDDLSATATMAYTDPDVGTNKTISLTDIALDGGDAPNYTLSANTASISGGEITKKSITVRPKSLTGLQAGVVYNLDLITDEGVLPEGQKVNGNVVPAFTTTYAEAMNTGYFVDAPAPNSVISYTEGLDGFNNFTIRLNADKLNTASKNYEIQVESADFNFSADYPTLDENYTLDPMPNKNGWSKGTVTVKPLKEPADGGYDQGYDKIQKVDSSTDTTKTEWSDSFSITESGEYYLRLKNDTTGAFTYVNQDDSGKGGKLTIKMDTEKPKVTNTEFKAENSVIGNFLETVFGNFYNKEVTVELTLSDTGSGLGSWSYGLSGTGANVDWKEEMVPASWDEDGKTTDTISFQIPMKQAGNVTFRVTDRAGNETLYDIKTDGSNSNFWIVENTHPTIQVTARQKDTDNTVVSNYKDDQNRNWYPNQLDFYAEVADTAADDEQSAGIYAVLKKQSGEDAWTEIRSGQSFEEAKVEKWNGIVATMDSDSEPTGEAVTWTFNAKDNATNMAANDVVFENIMIDSTAPVLEGGLTASVTEPTNQNVTISFTATDAGSGVAKVEYFVKQGDAADYGTANAVTIDGTTGKGSFTVPENGTYKVVVTDHVGHTAEQEITVNNIDKKVPLKPRVMKDASTEWDDDTWHNEAVTVSVSAEDDKTEAFDNAPSGIALWDYSFDGGNTWENDSTTEGGGLAWDSTGTNSFTVDRNAANEVVVRVKDKAGNDWVNSKEYVINVDTAVETLTATVAPDHSGQWTNESPVFTLTYGNGTGASGFDYQFTVDNGNTWQKLTSTEALKASLGAESVWNPDTNTLTVNGDVSKDIQFRVQTGSGNISNLAPENAYQIRLTQTLPVDVTETFDRDSVPQYDDWFNKGNGETELGRPILTIPMQATPEDRAPITTWLKYWPEILGEKEPADDANGVVLKSWTDKDNTVLKSEEKVTFPEAGKLEGVYYYKVWRTDEAGNSSEDAKANAIKAKVDVTDPGVGEITYTVQENTPVEKLLNKLSFGLFYNEGIDVTISVTDDTSGPGKVYYRTAADETSQSQFTSVNVTDEKATFTLPLGTSGVIRYYAEDIAGNRTAETSLGMEVNGSQVTTWVLENTAPEITDLSFNDGNATHTNGWYTDDVTVTAKIQDKGTDDAVSGLQDVQYQFGSQQKISVGETKFAEGIYTEEYQFNQTITEEGANIQVQIWAKDNALNEQTFEPKTIKLDKSAPTYNIENENGEYTLPRNDDYDIFFTAEDTVSKIAKVTLKKPGDVTEETLNLSEGKYTFHVDNNGVYIVTITNGAGLTTVITEFMENGGINNLDKDAPDPAGFTLTPDPNPVSGVYTQEVTVTLTSIDNPKPVEGQAVQPYSSGIKEWRYSTNRTGEPSWSAWQPWSTSAASQFKLTQSGTFILRAELKDAAGNIVTNTYSNSEGPIEVRVDTGNPGLEVRRPENTADDTWTNAETLTFDLYSSSEGSGTSDLFFYVNVSDPLDDTKWIQVYDTIQDKDKDLIDLSKLGLKGTWTTFNKGNEIHHGYVLKGADIIGTTKHSFKVAKQSDKEGLVSAPQTFTLNVDRTAPGKVTYFSEVDGAEAALNEGWYKDGFEGITLTTERDENPPATAPITTKYKLWKDGETEDSAAEQTYTSGTVIAVPEDGNWNLLAWAEDEAGNSNKGTQKLQQFKVDRGAPSVAQDKVEVTVKENGLIEGIINKLFGNFAKSTLEAKVYVTDSTSQAKTLNYWILEKGSVKPTENPTNTSPVQTEGSDAYAVFDISAEQAQGGVDIYVQVEDKAGNKSEVTELKVSDSYTWYVENAAPKLDIAVAPPADTTHDGWNITPVTVSGTISDSSGLDSVAWSLGKDSDTLVSQNDSNVLSATTTMVPSKEFSADIGVDGDGIYQLQITAKDNAMNEATWPGNGNAYKLKIDKTKPVISAIEGLPEAWSNQSQTTLTFDASDATSGVKYGSIEVKKGTDDSTENNFIVDANAGEILVTYPKGSNENFATEYNDISFIIKENGVYQIIVEDVAGNMQTQVFTVDKIDTTPPTEPVLKLNGEETYTGNWLTAMPTLEITAAEKPDSEKELSSDVSTYYQIWRGGELNTPVPDNLETKNLATDGQPSINADGYWNIRVWAEDAAGNRTPAAGSYIEIKNIKVDTKIPDVDEENGIVYTDVNNNLFAKAINFLTFGAFFNEEVRVKVTVTDNGYSSLGTLYYQKEANANDVGQQGDANFVEVPITDAKFDINTGNATGTATFDIPMNFDGTVDYYVEDVAGNRYPKGDGVLTLAKSRWIIESDKPVISEFAYSTAEQPSGATANGDNWYKEDVTVTFDVHDQVADSTKPFSGLNRVTWFQTAENANGENLPIEDAATSIVEREEFTKLLSDGIYNLKVTAKDNAGNEADEQTADTPLQIDTKAPVVKLAADSDDLIVPSGEEKTIRYNATDISDTVVTSKVAKQTIKVTRIKEEDGSDTPAGQQNVTVTITVPEDAKTGTTAVTKSEYSDKYNFAFTTDKNGTYKVEVTDIAGNLTTIDEVVVDGIDLTGLKPAKVEINGKKVNDGYEAWYNIPSPEIKITNPDEENYNLVSYQLVKPGDTYNPNGAFTDIEVAQPNITGENGTWVLKVKVHKITGEENVYTYTIKIDTVKPVITHDETALPTDWVDTEKKIPFTVTDELSLVNKDSIEVWKSNADGTALKDTELKLVNSEDELEPGTFVITSYTDETSGHKGYSGFFMTEGNYTYTIYAADVAMNQEEDHKVVVSYIDLDAPSPVPTVTADKQPNGNATSGGQWYKRISKDDAGIPVLTVTPAWTNQQEAEGNAEKPGVPGTSEVFTKYLLWDSNADSEPDESTAKDYIAGDITTHPTLSDGEWTMRIWAKDALHRVPENALQYTEYKYKVDTVAPKIAVSYSPDSTTPTSGSVIITVTLTDVTSKIDESSISVTTESGMVTEAKPTLKKVDDNTYQFTITVTKNSKYTINVSDKAGNLAAETVAEVTWIDTSNIPEAPIHYLGNQLGTGATVDWHNNPGIATVNKAESTDTAEIHTTVTVTKPDGKTDIVKLQDGLEESKDFDLSAQNGIWTITTFSEKQVVNPTDKDQRSLTYIIKVDTTKPEIENVVIKDKTVWTKGDQTVTFTVTDPTTNATDGNVSGVAAGTVTVTGPDNNPVIVSKAEEENGTYKFTFTATQNGTYAVNASDNAKNSADKVEVEITHIDKTAPNNITEDDIKVEGYHVEGNEWYNEKTPTISINKPEADNGAPLEVWWKLEYKATDEESDASYEQMGEDTQYGTDTTNGQKIPKLNDDGVYRLTVWTRDKAGNRSDVKNDVVRVIKVDTQAPKKIDVTVEPANVNSALGKIGNFLTFGNFFKEELKVTVTAEDATSGTECLYYGVDKLDPGELDTTDANRKDMENDRASFDIQNYGPGVRKAKFKLRDKAGNVSDVVSLVEGDKGSTNWIIEARSPEISGFKVDPNPNDKGWYNKPVTFTATVTDTESYLNKVDWLVTDGFGAKTETNLFTRQETDEAGTPTQEVKQIISADGETTVEIFAQDNAMNESRLSGKESAEERTIRIDTVAPVIADITNHPQGWQPNERIITFTVTDTPKDNLDILHSRVNPDSVEVNFEPSDGNPDAEAGKLVLTQVKQEGNTYTYSFQTRGNGTYTINAKDLADNPANALKIKVDNINTKELEAPKSTDSNWNRGYVDISPYTGEKHDDSSDTLIGWYAKDENPVITIKNSEKGPDNMPVTTLYKLWNTTLSVEPSDTDAKEIGYTGLGANMTPNTATITEGITWTDGTWKLIAWNKPAAGKESPRAEWTFMVDNTAPTVSETPEELKEINTDGWQKFINKLSFGLFYKEAIQVTVQVEDVTSHGETLYYQIETEKDGTQVLEKGKAEIKLTDENSTIGYATFKLPIGTKGKIAMWAEDFAGNVSAEVEEDNHGNLLPDSIGQVYLGYNGATWWELENTAPVITEISPVMDEKDVSVYLQGIVLTFNERVTAAEGKTVTISTGGEYYDYTLTEEDTKQIYLASPANADMGMDTPENVHGTYKVTLPINKFAERTTGESLSLSYNTDYIIRAEKGAFLDLATNEQVGGVYSVFTTEDDSKAEVPTIADLDVTGGQFIQIYPEFSSDNTEYVIVVADGALNEDKTQLAQDLILKAALTGDVELTEAVLKNFMGVTIDDDLSIQDTAAGSNVIVSADLIQAKENYILQLTISDHGKEQTYTFYVSTSAVTASTDYLTSGMPKVQVDTDELLVSLANEDLAQYLQKGLKVNIRMDISAPSLDSIPEEEAAFNALRTAMGEVEKHITYYPFDFTIWKAVSNGEMEKITRLREPITITIPIPSRIDLEDFRDVYRYHDGVPYKVQFTLNEAARTVTFEADEFSVYALAYYKEPSYSGGGGGGGGGGTGGGGGGGVVNVGSQVAYYGGAWQNDGWMFIKSDGTKPVNEWLNIDGKIYRFGLDGFMTTSFEKYQFNNDGSLAPASAAVVKAQAPVVTGTWLRDGWRYKTLSKTYLSGGWYYLYYNGLFDWYYFNDEGWMLDGWFAYGGETYYLHTTHDWSRGRMYMGWQVIDGKWYYFRMKADGKEGTLMRNSYTPDGHFVGADGAWDGRGSAPTAYVRK